MKKLDEPCIPYNGKLYTEYEISQMQRAGERKVRAWKRRCITAQEGVNSAADDVTKAAAQTEYSKSAVHLKANEEKLKDFCKQTGQDRDRFREQVYGFGRSEAQRAVQAAKVKRNHQSYSDSELGKKINSITGRKYLNAVKQFQESLQNIQNKEVSAILQRACSSVTFHKSKNRRNYFSWKENKIYLQNNVETSTIAHELFHKIDHDNSITKNKLLENYINFDYKNLKSSAEKAGLSIEDMLYLKYPKAFEKKGKMKQEYRGFSDIISGMTNGKIRLGYHHDDEYWKIKSHLSKETFAQYGRFYYDNNPEVMKLVTEMLPETSKQVEMLIGIISRFGG